MKPIKEWFVQLVDNNFIRCECNFFRGLSKGSSKYPLLRFWEIKGLAVGLVRRYPLQIKPVYKCTLRRYPIEEYRVQ